MTDQGQDKLVALQDRIDHRFRDVSLLERAVTHSSLSGSGTVRDLERLEFLGDRVLGLMTAETLWRRFPDYSEGDMAPRLNALVRKETCAKAARAIGLADALRMSVSEEDAGGRDKDAILGDACEALLGALYVDGGLKAAQKVFELYWGANFDKLAARFMDAKTALQEWAQSERKNAPVYKTISTEGPAHAPVFLVEAIVAGLKPARGEAGSKRAAQMLAAQAILLREKIWTDDDID